MGTQSSSLRTVPDPARTPIVDPATGMLTTDGFWFLYLLLRAAQAAEGTAILEAIDSGSEVTVIPGLEDFSQKVSAVTENTPGITRAQLEEVLNLTNLDAAPGITARQLEEVRALFEIQNVDDCYRRLTDLERLVAVGDFAQAVPPAAAAPIPVHGGGGVALDANGVPITSTPVPVGTQTVTTLPATAAIGQIVIYNGQPYKFTSDPSGGPTGYWALDVTGLPKIRDVFANLHLYTASSYPIGTIFFATDWLVSYAVQQLAGGKAWIYYNGIYKAPLANIPGGLGVNDINFTFNASDYLHNWLWNGSAWHLTTGGTPPGLTIYSASGPPFGGTGALWHLCDGSTQPVSQDDGTVVNRVLPTQSNYYFAR